MQENRIDGTSIDIYDEDGVKGGTYSCTHVTYPQDIIPGTSCVAQADFVLYNTSNTVTLVIEHPASNGLGDQTAKFVVPVN